MKSLRDRKGKFSKFDKRKYLFDSKGNIFYIPGVGIIDNLISPKKEKRKLKIKQRGKYESVEVLNFLDRKADKDIYSYLADKRINARVAKLKKKYPKSVITASVRIQIGKRKFQTRTFKVTDFNDVSFLGGKRKGKIYTAKDQVAYFIHDRINDTDYTLYKFETDHTAKVKKHGKNKKVKKTYSKEQSFEVTFKAIPKRSSKFVPSVANFTIAGKKKKPKGFR